VISAYRVGKGKVLTCRVSVIGAPIWGGCRPAAPPPPPVEKNTDFVSTMISKVLSDIRVSLNEPPKSADDW